MITMDKLFTLLWIGIFATAIAGCEPPEASQYLTYLAADGETVLDYIWEENQTSDDAPVLVLVHGGAWTEGDRFYPIFYDRNPDVAQFLSAFNIASIDYRLFQQVDYTNPYPAQINDVIAFIDQLGVEHSRICLLGHSAGAHIAVAAAVELNDIACVIGVSGIYDLREETIASEEEPTFLFDFSWWSNEVAGIARLFRDYSQTEVSPQLRIDENYKVPTLLIHGTLDVTVDYDQSKLMAQTINGFIPDLAEYFEVPGETHLPNVFGSASDTEVAPKDQKIMDILAATLLE